MTGVVPITLDCKINGVHHYISMHTVYLIVAMDVLYILMVTDSPCLSLWLRVLPLAFTLALPLTRAVRV